MLVFIVRRLLISIPVLIASTILTFIVVKLSGNPLNYLEQRNPRPPQSVINARAAQLYLNHSWPAQYWHWISDLVAHGNFGPPVQGTQAVGPQIGDALLVTARLVAAAIIIALILAVVTGVVSAVKQYSVTDYTTTFFGFLFLSMPTFWFAAILKQGGIEVNKLSGTQFFGTIGDHTIGETNNTFGAELADILGHLILPTIALGLLSYAAWSRFTRASMLEVLNSDYVRLARAKGLPRRTVLVRHALRNALIPLTTVTALDIAALLGGAIITEDIFQWHGMGNLFLTALNNIDFNIMLGWLLVAAIIVIAFNLLADILYGVLDPRIRNA